MMTRSQVDSRQERAYTVLAHYGSFHRVGEITGIDPPTLHDKLRMIMSIHLNAQIPYNKVYGLSGQNAGPNVRP